MLNVRRRVAAAAFLALSVSIVRAEETSTRPAKAYGPNDVTAFFTVGVDEITKSKIVHTLLPDAAEEMRHGMEDFNAGLNGLLGQDVGSMQISSMRIMLFNNSTKNGVAVIRGTWTPDQAGAIMSALERLNGDVDLAPVTVTYKSHEVIDITVDHDVSLDIGPMGIRARGNSKASGDDGDHHSQVFVCAHPKGPFVLGSTLASVARVLDALDSNAQADESKLLPALPHVEGSYLTVWASEIPGDESRSDLPGPLKSLKSFWLSAGETGEAAFVRARVELSSDEEAMRLSTMGGGLLMLAGSASDDATIKALVQAVHLSAKGPTVELEWSWPIARLGELKALADKSQGEEGHGGIKIQVQGSAEEVPATRRAR